MSDIKKVALLFSGGPAPAANAVISTCAISFLNKGIEVVGMKHGYSSLIDYSPDRPLVEDKDYITLHERMLRRTRSTVTSGAQNLVCSSRRGTAAACMPRRRTSARKRPSAAPRRGDVCTYTIYRGPKSDETYNACMHVA